MSCTLSSPSTIAFAVGRRQYREQDVKPTASGYRACHFSASPVQDHSGSTRNRSRKLHYNDCIPCSETHPWTGLSFEPSASTKGRHICYSSSCPAPGTGLLPFHYKQFVPYRTGKQPDVCLPSNSNLGRANTCSMATTVLPIPQHHFGTTHYPSVVQDLYSGVSVECEPLKIRLLLQVSRVWLPREL